MRPPRFVSPCLLRTDRRDVETLPERSNAGPVFDHVFRFVLFGILFRNVGGYVVRMFTCGRPLSCRVRLCGFLSFPACPECLGVLSRGAGIPCAGCLFAVPNRQVPLSSGTLPKADCNCGSRAVRIVFDPRNAPDLLRCPSKPPSGLFRGNPFSDFFSGGKLSDRRAVTFLLNKAVVAAPVHKRSSPVRLLPKNYRELPRSDRVRSGEVRGFLSWELCPSRPARWSLSALGAAVRFGGFLRCRCILLEVPGSGMPARRQEGSVSVFRGKALRSRPVCPARPRNGLSELRIEGLNDISGLS